MKAIETVYKGYRFRSRLEARWAVFFDAMGIDWEYEAEGYELSDGSRYLPDFWLPKLHGGSYAEVKPTNDFTKAKQLCADTRKEVLLLSGAPSVAPIEVYFANHRMPDEEPAEEEVVHFCYFIVNKRDSDGPRWWSEPAGEKWNFDSLPPHEDFLKAVLSARSARFEHGEVPR